MAMEIWNHECGPFRPNFAFFAIVCGIRTAISPWGKGPSKVEMVIIVANHLGLMAIDFRICASGSSGVIQLFVQSMIPPFAPHAVFCPIRVSLR